MTNDKEYLENLLLNDTDMTRQANELIAIYVKEAMESLEKAKVIADKYGVSFTFSPAYGMGGNYMGKNATDWDSSDCSDSGTWYPSSQSC